MLFKPSNLPCQQLSVVALMLCLLAGCHSGPSRAKQCQDIPPGAIPPPNGTQTCRWQNMQAYRAEQDDFTVHQREWYQGGDQLGPDGRKHAAELATRWDECPLPVVITPSEDDNLDAARRDMLVNKLTQLGVPDAEQRVIIGYPIAEGLYGQEAARYGMIRLQGGGIGGLGGGGFGGGGFGGGGFGGTSTAGFGGMGGTGMMGFGGGY